MSDPITDRADRTVWRVTAADLDELASGSLDRPVTLTDEELERVAKCIDNSTVNESIEAAIEQVVTPPRSRRDPAEIDVRDAPTITGWYIVGFWPETSTWSWTGPYSTEDSARDADRFGAPIEANEAICYWIDPRVHTTAARDAARQEL